MGYFLIVVGALTAIGGLMNGLTSSPVSAPQQAVQRLDVAIGILGLILAGTGYIAAHAKMVLKVLQDRPETSKAAGENSEAAQPAE